MSYILEALKKSEHERAHGGVPGLQADHHFQFDDNQKKPWWKYAFVIVLSVNLILGAIFFYTKESDVVVSEGAPEINKIAIPDSGIQTTDIKEKQDRPVVSQPVVSQAEISPKKENVAVSKQSSSVSSKTVIEDSIVAGKTVEKKVLKQVAKIPGSVSLQDELLQQKKTQVIKQARLEESVITEKSVEPPVKITTVEEKKKIESKQKSKPVVVANKTPAKSAAKIIKKKPVVKLESRYGSRKIVRISQLPDSVQYKLPDLKYSGHLFSSNPARRKLIINGRSMMEGDWVNDNLQLNEITSDGAVFAYKNYYYQVELLRNWSVN